MNQRIRRILTEIDRRREAREDPCESRDATGRSDGKVCLDCIGQKILLTRQEYDTLVEFAEDPILEAEIIE